VIHEFVGHAAMLLHPAIAQLSRVLDAAAESSSEEDMTRIERAY